MSGAADSARHHEEKLLQPEHLQTQPLAAMPMLVKHASWLVSDVLSVCGCRHEHISPGHGVVLR